MNPPFSSRKHDPPLVFVHDILRKIKDLGSEDMSNFQKWNSNLMESFQRPNEAYVMLDTERRNRQALPWVPRSAYFFLTMAMKNKTRIARVIPKKIMSVYGVSNTLIASSK